MTIGDLRIRNSGVVRGPRVRFTFDGNSIEAFEGESVAAALWAAGLRGQRAATTTAPATPYRVLFCMTGVCQQCLVQVDDRRVEGCRVVVRDGLVVGSAQ